MGLTAERLREVLIYDPETGRFTRRAKTGKKGLVGALVGCQKPDGRWLIAIDGKTFFASRLAWLYVHGKWPVSDVDHINRDPSDDRLANLRAATRGQNMANKTIHKNNKSGLKGVHLHPETGKWRAQIRINRKSRHLGLFSTKGEASAAYLSAALTQFGDFATSGDRSPSPSDK